MLVRLFFLRFLLHRHRNAAMPPPADPPTNAARRGLRSGRPTPSMRAHRGRPTPLMLSPRRSAAAWPRRRRHEPRRRLLCPVPPLGHRSRWPPRRSGSRTRAPRRCCSRAAARAAAGQPPPRALLPCWRLCAAARYGACVAEQGKKPLPLTSGARWSVG